MAANNNGNDDGPTAFDLAGIMLDMSQFVYRFYELRDVVRKHDPTVKDMKYEAQYAPEESSSWWPWNKGPKQVEFAETALIIQDDSANKNHPDRNLVSVITPQAIVEFLDKEVDGKKNRRLFKEDGVSVKFDETESLDNTRFHFLKDFKKYGDQNVQIIDYDDAFSTADGGLTFGLVANLTQKWVCVVFRGTIFDDPFKSKDWKHNMNYTLDTKSFFDANDQDKEEKAGTHTGFTSYLCSAREHDTESTRRYIDRIVSSVNFAFDPEAKNADEEKNPKPKIGPDFKFYVTGHSLGGGLANLFSYYVADLKSKNDDAAKHIPKQVNAITFAAPVVGNKSFAKKYEALEKGGFLRHIRMTNSGDPVPGTLPPSLRFLNVLPFIPQIRTADAREYVQNGVNIEFAPDGQTKIRRGIHGTVFSLSQLGFSTANAHFLEEFETRMESTKEKYGSDEKLGSFNKTLDSLYTAEMSDFV